MKSTNVRSFGERVSPDVDSQTFGHNGRKMLASGMYLADDSDQFIEWGREIEVNGNGS